MWSQQRSLRTPHKDQDNEWALRAKALMHRATLAVRRRDVATLASSRLGEARLRGKGQRSCLSVKLR